MLLYIGKQKRQKGQKVAELPLFATFALFAFFASPEQLAKNYLIPIFF
jgi:hypothetical protein